MASVCLNMLTSLLLGVFPLHAKTGRIRMSLRAIKSAHEPVVVGLAGMVQEQPATGLAGMDPAEVGLNMQKICSYMEKIWKKYAYI